MTRRNWLVILAIIAMASLASTLLYRALRPPTTLVISPTVFQLPPRDAMKRLWAYAADLERDPPDFVEIPLGETPPLRVPFGSALLLHDRLSISSKTQPFAAVAGYLGPLFEADSKQGGSARCAADLETWFRRDTMSVLFPWHTIASVPRIQISIGRSFVDRRDIGVTIDILADADLYDRSTPSP